MISFALAEEHNLVSKYLLSENKNKDYLNKGPSLIIIVCEKPTTQLLNNDIYSC